MHDAILVYGVNLIISVFLGSVPPNYIETCFIPYSRYRLENLVVSFPAA